MKVDVKWQGMDSLKADLDALTKNMQGSVIRTGLQAVAKYVVTQAESNVSARRLKKGTLGYKASYNGPKATARVGGKKGSKHFRLVHLVEKGTRPHRVNHPGTQPRPFLQPAVENNLAEINRKFVSAVRGRLDKVRLSILKKRGI